MRMMSRYCPRALQLRVYLVYRVSCVAPLPCFYDSITAFADCTSFVTLLQLPLQQVPPRSGRNRSRVLLKAKPSKLILPRSLPLHGRRTRRKPPPPRVLSVLLPPRRLKAQEPPNHVLRCRHEHRVLHCRHSRCCRCWARLIRRPGRRMKRSKSPTWSNAEPLLVRAYALAGVATL